MSKNILIPMFIGIFFIALTLSIFIGPVARFIYRHQLAFTVISIGIAAALLSWLLMVSFHGEASQFKPDLGAVASISAFLFFVYQLLAGAFFPTTSVTVDAVRYEDNPSKLIITVSLERGSSWLAQIESEEYVISFDHEEKQIVTKLSRQFPRKPDGVLRLGPGEKTATKFVVENMSTDHDLYVTAHIGSFAVFWPVLCESMARTIVPVVTKTAGKIS